MIDGIYLGFFTGALGSSFGVFLFKDGVIAGANAGGAVYDGHYENTEGGAFVVGEVVLQAGENLALITGLTTGASPLKLSIPIKLPVTFSEEDVHRIEPPAGPVNARFKKVRDLP